MPLNEAEQSIAIQAISRTVFDSGAWPEALRLLTNAGGGWASQIMGVDGFGRLQFNLASGFPTELIREFEMRGGHDPKINPRSRILAKPVHAVCSDRDLATDDELSKSEFVQDFLYRHDAGDMCLAKLRAIGDTQVAIAVSRSKRQGQPDEATRTSVRSLLPQIHAAIRMKATLGKGAAALANGALDSLNYAAFVIDGSHTIVGTTAEAEKMLGAGQFVRSRSQRLEAVDEKTNKIFQAALWLACMKPGSTLRSQISSVFFRSAQGRGAIADIAPLPVTDLTLRFGPVAVVAFGRSRPRSSTANLLRQTFELTPAESDVALALLNGAPTADIALRRDASVETVRKQIVSVFQKVGVNSRASLMKLLVTLIPGDHG